MSLRVERSIHLKGAAQCPIGHAPKTAQGVGITSLRYRCLCPKSLRDDIKVRTRPRRTRSVNANVMTSD